MIIMKQLQHLLVMKAIAVIALLGSCSSYEEPAVPETTKSTRSGVDPSLTYTPTEALSIANNALSRKLPSSTAVKVTPLQATRKELTSKLASDTVAFIINYPGNNGFVVVANDTRINPVIAYSNTGSISERDEVISALFFNKIQKYLANLSSSDIRTPSEIGGAPKRRFIIEPQISIQLGPSKPFNKLLTEKKDIRYEDGSFNYDGIFHSFPVVNTVAIMAHAKKSLSFKGYFYDFEAINYAINQNEGWCPPIQPFYHYDRDAQFIYSQQGALSAFNQLLYDFSTASLTQFKEDGTYTNPAWVYYALSNLDFSLTSFKSTSDESYNLSTLVSYLNTGYLLELFGSISYNNGDTVPNILNHYVSMIVDGCDVEIDNSNQPVSGFLHCQVGAFDIGIGYFSFPILLEDDQATCNFKNYFGVKIEE